MSTTLTTTKLGDKQSQPETQLDWCGQPFKPAVDRAYGGRPEHWPQSERLKHARAKLAKLPMSEERKAALRVSMAHARSVWQARRKARKAKTLQRDASTDKPSI